MTTTKEQKTVNPKRPLKVFGGGNDEDWNRPLAEQAMQTNWFKHSNAEKQDQQINATLAALAGIGPKDEIEGMLAAQMVAAHNATMESFRRAMLADQSFEGRNQNLNFANKCSRTYAALVEALNRHRGKGTQVVRVERVVVNEGGQAIVGAVAGGGRLAAKNEDQPHAKQIVDAQCAPMQGSLETEREALPIASGKRP